MLIDMEPAALELWYQQCFLNRNTFNGVDGNQLSAETLKWHFEPKALMIDNGFL